MLSPAPGLTLHAGPSVLCLYLEPGRRGCWPLGCVVPSGYETQQGRPLGRRRTASPISALRRGTQVLISSSSLPQTKYGKHGRGSRADEEARQKDGATMAALVSRERGHEKGVKL